MATLFASTTRLSSRLVSTLCYRIPSHFTRAFSSRTIVQPNASLRRDPPTTKTHLNLPSTPQHEDLTSPAPNATTTIPTAASSILVKRLSRKERDLQAIQEATGLLHEWELRLIANKQEKRAKWAERMHAKHGDNWEAVVQKLDRVHEERVAHQRLVSGSSRLNQKPKKQRWTRAQKDEHMAYKAEKKAGIIQKRRLLKEAKRARKVASLG